MLYDKRTPTAIVDGAPTGTAAESSDIDISNDPMVVLHVLYLADGAGKTLRLYPEVRLPVATPLWMPALSASLDVSGASVDAEGYLPLPGASPILEIDGVDGVEVMATLHIPVPTGDRFRVRYLEDGYDVAHPANVVLVAAAARGAS